MTHDRRTFIKTATVVTVGSSLAGCANISTSNVGNQQVNQKTTSNQTNTTTKEQAKTDRSQSGNGQLVFIYDDSPMTDYSLAFPIHQDENAPACVDVVTDGIPKESNLGTQQLQEMQTAGWEIMSHTKTHRAMGRAAVVADISPGDTHVRVDFSMHGTNPGDPIVISDGTHQTTVTVTGRGSDQTSSYLQLAQPVQTAFSAEDGTYLRFTDDILRTALAESKARLEELGLTVTNFVYPYSSQGPRADELIQEYYGGVGNWRKGKPNAGHNSNPYRTRRVLFRKGSMDLSYIAEYLDTVKANNMLGVFGGHTYLDSLTQERIRTAIQMAKKRGIEIVTLHEAFESQSVNG